MISSAPAAKARLTIGALGSKGYLQRSEYERYMDLFDSGRHLVTVHDGQAKVHQDQVGVLRVGLTEGFRAVGRFDYVVTLTPQNHYQKLPAVWIVLDEKNSCLSHLL